MCIFGITVFKFVSTNRTKDGTSVGTGDELILPAVSDADGGEYTCTATSAGQQAVSRSAFITVSSG